METPDANLAKGMRQLNGVYTQGFNDIHGRCGHVLQGRYKAIIVQKETYLKESARYIVLNSVPAGMVSHAADWPWSSYRATTGEAACPDWLRRHRYFSVRLARAVPEGQVFAVDIQPEMLALLQARIDREGLQNITLVQGREDHPRLAPDSLDAALLVDAYHEFAYPYEMMRALVTALRPGGRVVLIEYRGEDPSVPIKPLHKMTQAQAILEMDAVGLAHKRTLTTLPTQHILIFEKPGES